MTTIPVIPLIINNKDIHTPTTFTITNNNNGQPLHGSSSATTSEANQAAESARTAFKPWSKTWKPAARRDILLKAADILQARKDELLRYMLDETGAERVFGESQLLAGVDLIRDVAGKISSSITGEVPVLAGEGENGIVYKEPYGVVLAIAPWNAPYILGIRNIVLALAAGNTVILKGSEMAPECFWAVGDVFRQAGLPAGCLNVLYHRPEDAAEVTTELIAHPAIQKIGFTGSTHVGKIVASTAGRYAKPVTLELGGKAGCIVLEDADLEKAAMGCALGSFMNAGQVCMSTERIIVQRPIAEKFYTAFQSAIGSTYGPSQPPFILINPAAVTKSQKLVQDAVSKGAQINMDGLGSNTQDADADAAGTRTMRPTVLSNITKEMDIYKTESFGPTVSLFVVDSDADAVELANDTEYGLTAAVYTENLSRALKLARDIESGAVHINGMTIHDEAALPHGGVKQSGFGRFGGVNGLDEFLKLKSVTWKD